MTETGRVTLVNREPRMIHTRAFGRPFGGLEAKVADDTGGEVPRGTEGELLVRWGGPEGPRHGFFSGYLKDEMATEEAWRGGWFHTGDVVRQDPEGMLYFVDRKKNIIRRAGENIAAAEIEAVIQAHDEVAQVAVVAAPDEVREEEVMACIVAMPGVTADAALADRIFEWCLERLAYFKAPGWMLFVPSLPTTGTQKVQRARCFPKARIRAAVTAPSICASASGGDPSRAERGRRTRQARPGCAVVSACATCRRTSSVWNGLAITKLTPVWASRSGSS